MIAIEVTVPLAVAVVALARLAKERVRELRERTALQTYERCRPQSGGSPAADISLIMCSFHPTKDGQPNRRQGEEG